MSPPPLRFGLLLRSSVCMITEKILFLFLLNVWIISHGCACWRGPAVWPRHYFLQHLEDSFWHPPESVFVYVSILSIVAFGLFMLFYLSFLFYSHIYCTVSILGEGFLFCFPPWGFFHFSPLIMGFIWEFFLTCIFTAMGVSHADSYKQHCGRILCIQIFIQMQAHNIFVADKSGST